MEKLSGFFGMKPVTSTLQVMEAGLWEDGLNILFILRSVDTLGISRFTEHIIKLLWKPILYVHDINLLYIPVGYPW